MSFAIGEKGYVFGGVDGSTYLSDFYNFVPGYILLPAAPENLRVAFESVTSLKITWDDKSNNETSFFLEVSVNNSSYTTLTTLPSNSSSFVHESLTSGVTYRYRLTAKNALGDSPIVFSQSFVLIPLPVAPTNLTAAANGQSVILNWLDNADNEAGFDILRSIDDGATFTKIQTVSANSITATDLTVQPAKQYVYKVGAINSSGILFSNSVTAITPDVAPASPTAFTAISSSQTIIDLTWIDNSTNEISFEISRASGSTYVVLASLPANTTQYSDPTITPGIPYFYRLRALNSIGNSVFQFTSGTATLLIPEAPTGLKAELVGNNVVISWTDNAIFESGYELFRTEGNDSEKSYKLLGKDISTLSDNSFVDGIITYKYRVRATNTAGSSAFSNEGAVTLPVTLVTSLQENISEWLTVYPIPAKDKLVVKNNSEAHMQVRYFSIIGHKIYQHEVGAKTDHIVDTTTWGKGTYLLEVIPLHSNPYHVKVIIE